MAFQKGDRVHWEKNMRPYEGVVAAVVPAGKSPLDVFPAEEIRKCNIKPLGLISTLQPRDHESYLVECSVGERGIRALYWPATASLKPNEA